MFIPFTQFLTLSVLVAEKTVYIYRFYKVYNLGVGGDVGFTSKMAFPIGQPIFYDSTNLINSVEHIFKTTMLQQTLENQYQTSHMNIRFVKNSTSTLSMMDGTNIVMIEFDMTTGTYTEK